MKGKSFTLGRARAKHKDLSKCQSFLFQFGRAQKIRNQRNEKVHETRKSKSQRREYYNTYLANDNWMTGHTHRGALWRARRQRTRRQFGTRQRDCNDSDTHKKRAKPNDTLQERGKKRRIHGGKRCGAVGKIIIIKLLQTLRKRCLVLSLSLAIALCLASTYLEANTNNYLFTMEFFLSLTSRVFFWLRLFHVNNTTTTTAAAAKMRPKFI